LNYESMSLWDLKAILIICQIYASNLWERDSFKEINSDRSFNFLNLFCNIIFHYL
jgi:hypothetical protein